MTKKESWICGLICGIGIVLALLIAYLIDHPTINKLQKENAELRSQIIPCIADSLQTVIKQMQASSFIICKICNKKVYSFNPYFAGSVEWRLHAEKKHPDAVLDYNDDYQKLYDKELNIDERYYIKPERSKND